MTSRLGRHPLSTSRSDYRGATCQACRFQKSWYGRVLSFTDPYSQSLDNTGEVTALSLVIFLRQPSSEHDIYSYRPSPVPSLFSQILMLLITAAKSGASCRPFSTSRTWRSSCHFGILPHFADQSSALYTVCTIHHSSGQSTSDGPGVCFKSRCISIRGNDSLRYKYPTL